MSEKTNPLLDAAEVQDLLGISSATFYRWLRDGTLAGGSKVGGRWRFPRAVVEGLLATSDARQEAERADLGRAQEICRERLTRCGVAEKEIDALRQADWSRGEVVARLVVRHAIERGASDVHVAPTADGLSIRERVDGVLVAVEPPLPPGAARRVLRGVKRLAGLDLGVADAPQEGRFFAQLPDRSVDVRAATFPTALGESLTLRLLDPAGVRLQLPEAGYSEPLYRGILEAIGQSHGMFLVNGPSGSGKTTTLYCILTTLKRPKLKLMTIEDPVEVHLDGILQANVTEAMGFREAMTAMLRADLDVGLVGELRDAESIRLLTRMGSTGHLVLSVLHAPDAIGALQRILQVGQVEPRLLIDTLRGILDQRLVRTSCRHCRSLRALRPEDRDRLLLPARLRGKRFAYNDGCPACDGTGSRGRVPVGELLTISSGLAKLLEGGETNAEALSAALPADHRTLRDDLVDRLTRGEVSPPEAAALLAP